jgi:hypothetical protein
MEDVETSQSIDAAVASLAHGPSPTA